MNKNELNGWVLFSASWCGPCKAVKADLEKLPEEIKKSIIILNFDDNKDLFNEIGVRSVPQFINFKDGNIIEKYSGVPEVPNKVKTLFTNE